MYLTGNDGPYLLNQLPIQTSTEQPKELYPGPISTSNLQTIEVLRFTAKNGSADTNRDTDQLSATVVDSNNLTHPYLYIDNIRVNGTQLASNQFVLHPNINSINQILTQAGQELTTNFKVKVYDSNTTSVPAGLTEVQRKITFKNQ